MRKFVTSDTHGMYHELKSVLEKANFNYQEDQLIHLGDCVDRGPDSKKVIDLLLTINNLIAIRGNHDQALQEYIETTKHAMNWEHGGFATRQSYINSSMLDGLDHDRVNFVTSLSIPQSHAEFLKNQVNYYIDEENQVFVHAGFNRDKPIDEQIEIMYYWDRDLIKHALSAAPGVRLRDVNNFDRIFIGHTPTQHWNKDKPIYAAQVVLVDTGAPFSGKGWGGRVSLIDITDKDNHILYQS